MIQLKKVLLFIVLSTVAFSAMSQTFVQEHDISCGDTVYIGNLGFPTWAIANIEQRPTYGHAILLGDFIPANLLQYTSPPCFSGLDTVVISCAQATQLTCDTGIYVFRTSCPENLDNIQPYLVHCNDSIQIENLSGWHSPEIIAPAVNGEAHLIYTPFDAVYMHYKPNPGFEGLDAVKVKLSGLANDTALYLFQVYCDLSTAVSEAPTEADWLVYPNPAGDWLYLHTTDPLEQLWLVNALGQQKLLPTPTTSMGRYELNLAGLSAGLYVLYARTDQGIRWKRLVKK